jgi:hypothetical protein
MIATARSYAARVDGGAQTQTTLRALRRTRRRHYIREGDWVDSLYKAYIVVIVAALALFYGSAALGGSVDAAAARDVSEHGIALLGLGLAVLVAMGLRSGARGGPLAPESADVTFLLLAPVPRGEVLRSLAVRQLRGVVFVPAVIGAVAGNLAAGRLGGERAEWLLAGAAFGALASLAVWASALVASGGRVRARDANLIGAVVVLWAVLDVAIGRSTSPTAQIARVALWPLVTSPLALVGIALPLALVAIGLARVGRMSLEPLRHRAQLVGELRFAATLQDMRSVIVLHRELAQELPRSKPWWRSDATRGGPAWQRDWRGLARWPLGRVVRTVVLTAVVVVAGIGLWHGVDALVLLGGVALFLVGVDAVEGLAQETDHPARPQQYPIVWGDLVLAHLLAPGVVLLGVMVAVALATGGATGDLTALALAAVTVVPATLAAVVGAGLSVAIGAPPPTLYLDFGFPELTTLWLVLRQVLGPLLVVAAFVPLAVGENASVNGQSAAGATATAALVPIALAVGGALWLRSREAVVR